MIVTDLKHIDHQISMTPALNKAMAFLRRQDLQNLADGKVEIDGDRVFANVQRYETMMTAAPKFEHHRKHIDVQYIVSGEEIIGWAPMDRMAITEAYDADRDIGFGTVMKGRWTPLFLQAGQLAVLYPDDGHAPKLAAGASSSVMKIVVKVAV
jgi:YhcH/YjgK/YiaL family protein